MRILICLLALVSATSAGAQERPLHPLQVGITAGTLLRLNIELSAQMWEDAWIGVLFHPTRSIALRPSIVFAQMTDNIDDNLTGTSYKSVSDLAVGGALAGFYYLPARASLFLYAGPEVKYFYLSQSEYYSSGTTSGQGSWHMLQISLLFGAQYMLSQRFGFQADIGAGCMLSWIHRREWNPAGTLATDQLNMSTTFVTRGAYLGAIFYLN
jgi:hypothetical protein